MKKLTIIIGFILILTLGLSCLVGCDKIKADDVQGEWFFEDGKLEISGENAKLNGEEKEYSLDKKNGKMTLLGEEYLFGDKNTSLYLSSSKVQNVMAKPEKRDSFQDGEGFAYIDAQGRLCSIAFLSGERLSVTFTGSGNTYDLGEGEYKYSDGVITALVNFIQNGPTVQFYYIDENIDLYTKAGVRQVADFAKETYDKQINSQENPDDEGTEGNETDTFLLTYRASVGGYIIGRIDQVVKRNASGDEVTAVADKGYRFIKWSDGVTSASRTDTSVNGNISVTAKFEPILYSVRYSAAENGRISGNADQTVMEGFSSETVVAEANEGYVFAGWSDGVKTKDRKDENVTSDINVTAYFIKGNYLNYEALLGGSIEGETKQLVGKGLYGTQVTAVPNEGYVFAGWSDGNMSPVRQDIGGVTDITYTARFAEGQNYVVTYNAGEGGKIQGIAVQQVSAGEDALSVTAVADTGYVFLSWSDGLVTPTRTDEKITENKSYLAIFLKVAQSIVTIDYGDGSEFKITLTQGDKVNFPIKERIGYKFMGFDTPQGRINNGSVWQQDYDCTVTAVWEPITYTIVLNAGEGSVSERRISYTVEDLPMILPVAEHPSKVFKGWKDSDGNTIDTISLDNIGDYYLTAQYGEVDDN